MYKRIYDSDEIEVDYDGQKLRISVFDEDGHWTGEHFLEAEPVVHAHWFLTEPEFLDCSACGTAYYTGMETWSDAQSHLEYAGGPKRCPHCGAHMDEEVADG